MKRVVLFTPFAPNIGGGGAILRSLLAPLQDSHPIQLEWCYTAPEANTALKASGEAGTDSTVYTYLGPEPFQSGWRSMVEIVPLWGTRRSTTGVRRLTAQLEARHADAYWMVGHMEAVLVADLLARHGHQVHLTMHDDLAHGQFARSKRYRFLTGIGDWRLRQAMRGARTMDTVCQGMRDYYFGRWKKDSVVVHRFVPALPGVEVSASSVADKTLHVGHIGSIYSVPEFRSFCLALQDYARQQGLEPHFTVIAGYAEKTRPIFEEFGDLLVSIGHMDEGEAIQRLSKCHFLYAMYPFSAEMEMFRRTSSPTKLTTYIQAQRPILGHTPTDSSLQDVVTRFGLGQTCDSLEIAPLVQAIAATHHQSLAGDVTFERFEAARETLHGAGNIRKLAHCLTTGTYPI